MQTADTKQHTQATLQCLRIDTITVRINPIGFSNNTHLRMEALTDFLFCLREREAAQLTHGASYPLLDVTPSFFFSPSKTDRWSESPASPRFTPSLSRFSPVPPPQKDKWTRWGWGKKKTTSLSLRADQRRPSKSADDKKKKWTSGSLLSLYIAMTHRGGVWVEREGEQGRVGEWGRKIENGKVLSVGDKKDNKCNFLMCVGWGKWRRDMYNKQSVCVCVCAWLKVLC